MNPNYCINLELNSLYKQELLKIILNYQSKREEFVKLN